MTFETALAWSRSTGLIYFLILFVAIVAWALWPRNRSRFEDDARIPFKED